MIATTVAPVRLAIETRSPKWSPWPWVEQDRVRVELVGARGGLRVARQPRVDQHGGAVGLELEGGVTEPADVHREDLPFGSTPSMVEQWRAVIGTAPLLVGGVRELLGELEPDRDADQHPEPGLLGDERAHRAQPLVGILLRARPDATCASWAEPNQSPSASACGEHALQVRRGVRDDLLGVAEARRVAQRLDGRVDLLRGVPAAGHGDAP